MALFTGHFLVGIDQRKLGLAVIKGAGFFPGVFIVARLALFAEAAFVRVVGLVAADAFQRGLAIGLARLVAAFASRCRVLPIQLEVGLAVVERALVQTSDICVRALMLLVTMAAF